MPPKFIYMLNNSMLCYTKICDRSVVFSLSTKGLLQGPVLLQGLVRYCIVPSSKGKRDSGSSMKIPLSGGGMFRCPGITAKGGCILLCPMTEPSQFKSE